MKEEWKDIPGYEGLYQVSSYGKVKSNPRNGTIKNKRILKVYNDRYGYLYCVLSKKNKKKKYKVHRLVAKVFIPNLDNLPQVNHKDENKLNNCVDNLEWCTPKYNLHYGNRISKLRKKVIAIDKYNNTHKFISINEAGEALKVDKSTISKCCKDKRKSAGGYKFKYGEKI